VGDSRKKKAATIAKKNVEKSRQTKVLDLLQKAARLSRKKEARQRLAFQREETLYQIEGERDRTGNWKKKRRAHIKHPKRMEGNLRKEKNSGKDLEKITAGLGNVGMREKKSEED